MELLLRAKNNVYSFEREGSKFKVIEDLKYPIYILNEDEFEAFLVALYGFVNSEDEDIQVFGSLSIDDKDDFLAGFRKSLN
jgi:hypothetical protein